MDKILTNYKWLFFLGSWSLVPKACYDKLVSFLMDNIGTPLDKDDLQWEDVNLDSHSRDSIDDTIYKDTVTGKEPDTNPYEEPLSDSEDLEAHEEEISNKLEAGLQNLKQNATINSSLLPHLTTGPPIAVVKLRSCQRTGRKMMVSSFPILSLHEETSRGKHENPGFVEKQPW